MNNTNKYGLNLDDPDRLPWLETADGSAYDDTASPFKLAFMFLAGLVLLAAIIGAIYWLQRNQIGGANGNGQLIAAPAGAYKVKPQDAGGKRFEGEGDSAFAASEGTKAGATLVPAAKTAATAPPAAIASAPVAAPATAAPAPARTPALFKPQSTLEGTRAGKKSCKLSMPRASIEPKAKVKTTTGKCLALLWSAKAMMKPNGA